MHAPFFFCADGWEVVYAARITRTITHAHLIIHANADADADALVAPLLNVTRRMHAIDRHAHNPKVQFGVPPYQ